MKESEDSRSGAAKAVHRVSQVTTVGLMLALPILAGHYADQYFGTSPWLTILLFVFGCAAAGFQLISLVKSLEADLDKQ